jgi:hypothetical protein
VLIASGSKRNSIFECNVPADGTRAANVRTGDFGTSPIFVQLSSKPLLASVCLVGVSEHKAQWQIEKIARRFDSMMEGIQ